MMAPDLTPLPPGMLRAAPELALVDLLLHALGTALLALRAEHPTLDQPTGPREPPTLRHARVVARSATLLVRHLAAYRNAVVAVLAPAPGDDDLPF
jgi:hypothetical protein